MNEFIKMLLLALSAVCIENTIFAKSFGTSTLLFVSRNKKAVIPFGLSITYICVVSSALSYFVDKLLVDVNDSYLYLPIAYVVTIGFVYIITLLLVWKFAYNLFVKVKDFIHISTFNCAVLGALFINNVYNSSFLEYVIYGFGTGIGFLLASFIVSQGYRKFNSQEVPDSFRGFPAAMLYIGIISMVLFAFLVKMPQY